MEKIFINCPFDEDYKKQLRAILFTSIYCGLEPTLSQLEDSGSIRVNNIIKLIKESELSVHDLSRVESSSSGELARFNMPFELGIEIGIRAANNKYSNKKCLVIDSDPYRLKAALSDLAGADIESYGSEEDYIKQLIIILRSWFYKVFNKNLEPASHIFSEFIEFKTEYLKSLVETTNFMDEDIERMTPIEYIRNVQDWLSQSHQNENT